jgi:serine/threonine protein kinase
MVCNKPRLYCHAFDKVIDEVFLDENNIVKLGDFGLAKALAQTSFANTYVGVCDIACLRLHSTDAL